MSNPFFDIVLPFNDAKYWCEVLDTRMQEYKKKLAEDVEADREIDPFEVIVRLSGFLNRLEHLTEDLEQLKPHLAVPDDIKHHLT